MKNQQNVKSSDKRTPVEIVNFLICLLCSMMGVASDVMFGDYQKIRLRLAALGFIVFFCDSHFFNIVDISQGYVNGSIKISGYQYSGVLPRWLDFYRYY